MSTKSLEEMSVDELKDHAKKIGIKVPSKEKKDRLINIIKAAQGSSDKTDTNIDSIVSAINEMGGEQAKAAAVPLPPDKIIAVKSITFGTVIYTSRSDGKAYIWNDIGAAVDMTAAAVSEMNAKSPEFLKRPMLILLDDDAVNYFGLAEIYRNVSMINDLEQLLSKDLKTVSRTIDNALSVNMRNILISKVRSMYANDRLKNIDVIKLLEDKLRIDIISN